MAVFFLCMKKSAKSFNILKKIKCELRHKFDLKSKKIILELVNYREEQKRERN